jgi:ATP phosphoribosyltransferase regulatory subunit
MSAIGSSFAICGGQEICDQALQLSADATARASIQHLCEIWDVLKAYGVSEYVMIDLTMIGDFSYYTGMTFEGYAADLGFPVVSGGRYDNLLAQFGRPAPATGFALKTTRVLELLGDSEETSVERTLVVYDAEGRAAALKKAQELRAAGVNVVTERVAEAGMLPGKQLGADATGAAETAGTIETKGLANNEVFVYKGVAYTKLVTYTAQDGKGGNNQ